MEQFFAEGYHGGFTAMGRWAGKGYSQAPIWEHEHCIPRWFREHLFRRIDEFDGHKSGLEIEAVTFEYWRKHHPELVTEIVRRIERGQLEIVDGTYTQPYGHTIGHESMVRQFLYGQEVLEQVTGRKSVTHYKQEHMFVPNMPGLLLSAGFKSVLLRSHIHHFGCCPAMDEEFILWQGRDGSRIPTVPNYVDDPYPYAMGDGVGEDIEAFLDRIEAGARSRKIRRLLLSHGLDIAHDPDFIRAVLPEWQERRKDDPSKDTLHHEKFMLSDWPEMGMSDEKLRRLRDRGYRAVLPSEFIDGYGTSGPERTFDADYFQYDYLWGHHGDRLMTANKSAESSLYTAGVLGAVVAMLALNGYEEDEAELDRAWKLLLEAQSHDVHICPTSFSLAVSDFPVRMGIGWSREAHEIAEDITRKNLGDVLISTTRRLARPTVILFNPLSFHRTDAAWVTIRLPKGFAGGLRFLDGSRAVPYDCVACSRHSDGTICRAEIILPGNIPGFAVQEIAIEPASELSCLADSTADRIDTGSVAAQVTKNGTLAEIKLSAEGDVILSDEHFAGNELTADFSQGLVRTGDGEGNLRCSRGQYLTRFLADTKLGDKDAKVRLDFYRDSARIDCSTEIDFGFDANTAHKDIFDGEGTDYFGAVRANFSPVFDGEFFSDLPLSVERSERTMVPGQSFGCLTDGQRGLTLINQGNIGYYRNQQQGVRLSLMLGSGRSSSAYGPYPLSEKIAFRYSCIAHQGNWFQAGTALRAAEIQSPVQSTMVWGKLRKEYIKPFLTVRPEHVLATAMFNRKGMMFLRLWNCSPELTEAHINSRHHMTNVCESNIFGEDPTPLKKTGKGYLLELPPFALKTVVWTPHG